MRVFRLRLDLAYVGRDFHGWQIQPDARTVQGELRSCLTRLLGRDGHSGGAPAAPTPGCTPGARWPI